ncbi:forkhead box protein C1-A [Anopheles nili]|uniref:forkhead box protein C1-A n=1 Tax=Anopheles nili TaxID=185578 RepID=UPI00237B4ED2|nr:forkhead box protein C1-A [Anopheles nili]
MSDLYISDSMQDLLDMDIKTEVTTVVGGVNEFVSLMNYDLPSLELDSNSLDGDNFFSGAFTTGSNDLYADVGTCANPNYVMPVLSASSAAVATASLSPSFSTGAGNLLASQSSSMSALLAAQSLLKSPKQNLNLNTTVHGAGPNPTLPSPKERKSHLTFSPNLLKVPMVVQEAKKMSSLAQITRVTAASSSPAVVTATPIQNVRKDLSAQMALKEEKIIVRNGIVKASASEHLGMGGGHTTTVAGDTTIHKTTTGATGLGVGLGKGNTIKLAAGIGGLTFANSVQFKNLKSVQKITNASVNGGLKRDASPHRQLNGGASSPKTFNRGVMIEGKAGSGGIIMLGSMPHGSPTAMVARQVQQRAMTPTGPKQKPAHLGKAGNGEESEFPKPAYSYSCLIAMALKNSRSGSLPVSEIYSFMCEHFPYFKTAPTGWKNSVRHNLSLNKCFEKIEKPATNGGQRKGCLWAMNPAKITKMDEEVQKWSRKDPQAIRRAMVHPEHLEALERGEMKHGSTGDDDLDDDLESDGGPSDVDAEEVDEEVVDPDEDEEEDEEDEEEEEDDVELIEQHHETIDVDAESFIINTPESLIDGDEDGTGEHVDFDLEVPDFYENINVDSKDSTLAMDFTQQDLLSLEDEDESLYIGQLQQQHRLGGGAVTIAQQPQVLHQTQIIPHHRQASSQQPLAKRARLDVNYSISSPAQNGTANLVNVISSRQPTIVNGISNGNTVTVTTVNGNNAMGMSFQQQFQQQSTLQHQQQIRQQQHQQGTVRRKIPMITRLV